MSSSKCAKEWSMCTKAISIRSLLRLILIAIVALRFRHVCAFQSMATPPQRKLERPTPLSGQILCAVSPPKPSSFRSHSREKSSSTCLKVANGQTSQRALQWEKMFCLLSVFIEREGNGNVPHHHKEDGENLGRWISTQREKYKAGKLEEDRKTKLESLGALTEARATRSTASWEDMYLRLVEYKEREGHTQVPYNYKDGDGENLGPWLNTQRQSKKKGHLDKNYQDQLEALGVVWDVSSTQWENMFSLLTKYKRKRGNCNVPRNHDVVGLKGTKISLGTWVDRQRRYKKMGSLDEYRIRKLEGIGFDWERETSRWNEMFDLLCDYKEREGHSNVPRSYKVIEVDGTKNLGSWLGTQRQAMRKGTLKPSRKARLESLGVEWGVLVENWDLMFDLLVTYQSRHGHCRVPAMHEVDGKPLGKWLAKNRLKMKNGKLGSDKSRALEDLGVRSDLKTEKWDQMVSLLGQYKEQNGHCRVPHKHKEGGMNLGTWLNSQRQSNRAGKLHPSRKRELEELGVSWNLKQAKWDEMLALLVQYKEREGDCVVPQTHKEGDKNLGAWVDTQRQLHKKGDLDDTKKASLEAIGMVWGVLAFNEEEMMVNLLQYKNREGDCNVPASHIENGKALGSWLNRQRRLRTTDKLSSSLSKELEAAGVIWSTNEQKWEDWIVLLDQFRKREGHCRVPQEHKEGKDEKNLGKWLDYQRYKKKNGKLDAARQTRLEEIGIAWEIYAKFENDDDDWGFEGMDHLFDDEDMYT